MARRLVLRPSAKINLMLRVGERRDDGYHDVRTLFQSLALSDTMVVTARSGPFSLAMHAPDVPSDRTNLVWRAAALLWQAMGRDGDPRDAHVKLDKLVPAEAGLGGGSADAAAALVALNTAWEARLGRRELMQLARTLGSDVPFSLCGGTALGVGRGEELYPVDDLRRLGVVIVKPSFGIPTADAYGWLDEDRAAGVWVAADAGELDAGWPSGPVTLGNDFEAAVGRRHPEIVEMIAACRRAGALAAGLTGSGSAVFGLFPESKAGDVVRRLQRPEWLVLVTRTLNRREAVRRLGL